MLDKLKYLLYTENIDSKDAEKEVKFLFQHLFYFPEKQSINTYFGGRLLWMLLLMYGF